MYDSGMEEDKTRQLHEELVIVSRRLRTVMIHTEMNYTDFT